jgi:hypothetical protein
MGLQLKIYDDEWMKFEAARARADALRTAARNRQTPVAKIVPHVAEQKAQQAPMTPIETEPLEKPMSEASRKMIASRKLLKQRNGRKCYDRPIRPGSYRLDILRKSELHPKGCRIYSSPIGPRRNKQPRAIQTPSFWAFDVNKMQAVAVRPDERMDPMIVAEAVCAGCKIVDPSSVVHGRSRSVPIVLMRHICFYAMNKGPRLYSLQETGRRFDMDHTSVRHGVIRIGRLIRDGVMPDPLPILFPPKESADA